jgi:solute carrier family 45 protein 1/2/4
MGALSDRSRISWGRRRPFIVGGAVGTISSLVLLALLQEIMKGLTRFSYGDADDNSFGTVVIILAIVGVYLLNISIQPLQMGLRAAIIENCPKSQQEQASSWASRMTGVGNIIGYLAGIADLSGILPLVSLTQFQGLCFVASVALAIGAGMSCIAITEQNPEHILVKTEENSSLSSYCRRLAHTYRAMPWKVRKVCKIQFCAWLGWFPVLFYSTT